MVLPGHLAGGYLTATALLAVFSPDLSITQTNALLIIGTIAGELPDIDLLFFNIAHRLHHKKIKNGEDSNVIKSHRDYITHMPIFWLIISLIIVIIGEILNSSFIIYMGWIILGGTWSHLILDSIEYGILWLAPLSKKNYALAKSITPEPIAYRQGSVMQHFHFIITTYWKNYTFWLEIMVTIVGFCILAQHL